jgi:hypothetical protein
MPSPSHPSSSTLSCFTCICINLIYALNYLDIKILVVHKFICGF